VPLIITLFYIGFGGFLGSVLRYLLKELLQTVGGGFPLGTLIVNILGSFLLGFLVSIMENKYFLTEDIRLFLKVGLLGGFTTMSTFSYDSYRMIEKKDFGLFLMNVGGTITLTLLAVFFGIKLGFTLMSR